MTLTQDTIEETLVLNAPLEKVWAALTEPAQMQVWYATSKGIEGRVAEGEDLFFSWDEARLRVHVVKLNPMTHFAFRWIPSIDSDAPVTEDGSSLVTFTLVPMGDKTQMTLVESGLESLGAELQKRAHYMNSWGWDSCFNKLRNVLKKEGELEDSMHFQCEIEAKLERVWNLLTSVEGFKEGMGFPMFEGEIGAGKECTFTMDGKRSLIRFETIEPMKTVTFRWTPGECNDEPIDSKPTTLVTIQLVTYEDKTLLLLREEGFRSFLNLNGQHRFEMNYEGWGVEVLPVFKKYAEAK